MKTSRSGYSPPLSCPVGGSIRLRPRVLSDDDRGGSELVAHGEQRGDRVAMLLPPTPETAAAFIGTWKTGAILLSMSVLYGDEGIRHRLTHSQSRVLVTDAAARPPPVLRLSAQGRVRDRAAEDADGQDPADRAAPEGAGG